MSAPTSPTPSSPPRVPRVLVVEDDPHLRDAIRWLLEDEGLVVDTAEDGQQALDWLAAQRPALIVLDMGLPRVDGDGVAAGLRRAHGSDVPIVLTTADGRAQEKARRVGATAYLHKPFELDHFVQTVRRALDNPSSPAQQPA